MVRYVVDSEINTIVHKYKGLFNLTNEESGEVFEELESHFYSSVSATPTIDFQSNCCLYAAELVTTDPYERVEIFGYLKSNNIH